MAIDSINYIDKDQLKRDLEIAGNKEEHKTPPSLEEGNDYIPLSAPEAHEEYKNLDEEGEEQ